MTYSNRLAAGISLGFAAYSIGCAILGLDPMALPMKLLGMVPILMLLFLAPFAIIAFLAGFFRR